MTEKFEDFLNYTAEDIERPKPLPIGTYLVTVDSNHRVDRTTSEKQTQFVEYTFHLVQAGEDIDQIELEASGGIDGKTLRHTFYLTPKSNYRVLDFAEACGVKTRHRTIADIIPDCCNCEVAAYIGMEEARDGSGRMFPRAQRFISAADFFKRQQAAE